MSATSLDSIDSLDSTGCAFETVAAPNGQPQVEGLYHDGTLVVTPNGCDLRRVRSIDADGRYVIHGELLRPADAQKLIASIGGNAEAIDYAQAFAEAKAAEDRS